MTYQQALAYLDDHAGYQKTGRIDSPSLDTISRLCGLMGEPQHCAPVIHITGTNGKGSIAQMITHLLMASGLRVGTYTSPHLERVNEPADDFIPRRTAHESLARASHATPSRSGQEEKTAN